MTDVTTFDGTRWAITTTQGDTWSISPTVSTRLDGVKTPIDLTGATISGYVRPNYTSGVLETMTIVPGDLSLGQFTAKLSAAQTAALPAAGCKYQIIIDKPGQVLTIIQGVFQLRARISTI